MRFVMHAFNNHIKVLHDVTPIDGRIYKSAPATQVAVLSDGVVFCVPIISVLLQPPCAIKFTITTRLTLPQFIQYVMASYINHLKYANM